MTKRELGRYRTILSSRLAVLKEHQQVIEGASSMVDKLQTALRKLDSGSFGLCESCGGRITATRLETQPATTYCAACKRGSRTF